MVKVIIIGSGGHAKVVANVVESCGDELVGFLDENLGRVGTKVVGEKKVLGGMDKIYEYSDCEFVLGIGSNSVREKIVKNNVNTKWYTAIHPASTIGSDVEIGEGTVIMPNVTINTGARIGQHAIINSGAIVEHDDEIDDFVHLSPGAVICGTVKVGCGTWIGAGAVVINNMNVCEKVVIGAGAVVIKAIDEPGIYVGVPARRVK